MTFFRSAWFAITLVTTVQFAFANVAHAESAKDIGARIDLAKQIFAASGQEEAIRAIIPMLFTSIEPLIKNQKGRVISDREIKAVREATTSIAANNIGSLSDGFAQLYANEFTLDELQSVADFYHSPAGRHVVKFQPEMMQEVGILAKRWSEKLVPKITREVNRILKEKKS